MPTLRDWVIELVVMIAVGIALAALGPFGSFSLGGFGARLLYWVPAALIGYGIFRPTTLFAILAARRLDLPELPAAVFATLVAAVPGTVAIALFGGALRGSPPRFDQWFELYVNVAVIGSLVMIVFLMLGRAAAPTQPVSAAPVASAPPFDPPPKRAPFLNRLPPAWADHLLALEMEDHYVRAHGNEASALILMRMRDAESELAGIEGLRIHRSWWIARAAVAGVQRDGRGYRLRLTNGIEAPVARDRVPALRDAGWLN